MWTLHRIQGRLSSSQVWSGAGSPLSTHHCRRSDPFQADSRYGQHFFESIECLKDGTSSEEASTTVHHDAVVEAGRIIEDVDTEEVVLQHTAQHLLSIHRSSCLRVLSLLLVRI